LFIRRGLPSAPFRFLAILARDRIILFRLAIEIITGKQNAGLSH